MVFHTLLFGFLIAFILLFSISFLSGVFVTGPFVPTRSKYLKRFSKIVPLKKGMVVYDLGCGDGRLIRYLAKHYDVDARGYEISPFPYLIGAFLHAATGSSSRIYFKNFFTTSLSDADVIFVYLVPDILKKLGKKVRKECKKGTYIVSQTFSIEGLKPHRVIEGKDHPKYYLYRI